MGYKKPHGEGRRSLAVSLVHSTPWGSSCRIVMWMEFGVSAAWQCEPCQTGHVLQILNKCATPLESGFSWEGNLMRLPQSLMVWIQNFSSTSWSIHFLVAPCCCRERFSLSFCDVFPVHPKLFFNELWVTQGTIQCYQAFQLCFLGFSFRVLQFRKAFKFDSQQNEKNTDMYMNSNTKVSKDTGWCGHSHE